MGRVDNCSALSSPSSALAIAVLGASAVCRMPGVGFNVTSGGARAFALGIAICVFPLSVYSSFGLRIAVVCLIVLSQCQYPGEAHRGSTLPTYTTTGT